MSTGGPTAPQSVVSRFACSSSRAWSRRSKSRHQSGPELKAHNAVACLGAPHVKQFRTQPASAAGEPERALVPRAVVPPCNIPRSDAPDGSRRHVVDPSAGAHEVTALAERMCISHTDHAGSGSEESDGNNDSDNTLAHEVEPNTSDRCATRAMTPIPRRASPPLRRAHNRRFDPVWLFFAATAGRARAPGRTENTRRPRPGPYELR